MRTHINIAALLVVASALLSSCELLVPSPIHYPKHHHHFAGYEPSYYGVHPHRNNKVYKGVFEVPAEGGIYEFDCANDQFFISRIFDSSMLYERSKSRYSPTTDDYIDVDDLTYSGSFYTITCNNDEHNWVIKVDPIMATSDVYDREIWVFMWDESDDSNLVFQFEQADPDRCGHIE